MSYALWSFMTNEKKYEWLNQTSSVTLNSLDRMGYTMTVFYHRYRAVQGPRQSGYLQGLTRLLAELLQRLVLRTYHVLHFPV